MSEVLPASAADGWRGGSRLTTAVHAVFGGIAGLLLFSLMAITIVDVAGRYLFGAPLPGGNEIIQLAMAATIYSALPSVSRQEGHIVVDLFDTATPDSLVRPRQFMVNGVVLVALATITWCLWLLAEDLRDVGETWEYLDWQRSPIVYLMCFFSLVGTLIVLLNLLRYARGARRPEPGFI